MKPHSRRHFLQASASASAAALMAFQAGAAPKSPNEKVNIAGIGIGGMGAALLMAHQDVLQPAAGFCLVQLVIDGQDGAAWIAEDVLHPVEV